MAGEIICIAGPPGSGKSTYLKTLGKENPDLWKIDDYHADAIDNLPNFEKGRCYEHLIKGLKLNQTWACSDIEWCIKDKRDNVTSKIKGVLPDTKITWIYAKTSLKNCLFRLIERHRCAPSKEEFFKQVDKLYSFHHDTSSFDYSDCKEIECE